MSRRVVITGLGLVSPLGVGVQQNWKKLLVGDNGMSKLTAPEYESIPCRVAARVPSDELNLEQRFPKSDLRTLTRATLFSLIAAEEALLDAGLWTPPGSGSSASAEEPEERPRTGVAIGAGMVDLVAISEAGHLLEQAGGYRKLSPHFVTKILLNMAAGQVSIRFRLRGPNHCVSTACTTGLHAIGDAFNFIRLGHADGMLCGGTEAVISPLSIAAFAKIRALTREFNECPELASRPFDHQRSGFVMGEGCGLLHLEELEHALARRATIHGEVLGYGLSGDANHATAPEASGRGAVDCMRAAVREAAIGLEEVEHVNCHATSTPIGDQAELRAIRTLFGQPKAEQLILTSTKGATGHLLGAAGSVEAIFAVLACARAQIPPTVNLDECLDPSMDIVKGEFRRWPTTTTTGNGSARRRRIALTNSFGFGGTNGSLVVSNFLT